MVRLSSGQSFGEKALLDDAPRAATIVALQECYFAVIGRDDYKKCLQRIEQRANSKRMEFFRHIPILQHWTRNQLSRLVDSFTERNYLRN